MNTKTIIIVLLFIAPCRLSTTSIFDAIRNKCDLEEVKKIYSQNKQSINTVATDDIYYPLHTAAENNCVDIIEFLLNKKSNIEAKDARDFTPLEWAARSGSKEAFYFLLDKGANIHNTNRHSETLLHSAAVGGNKNIVQKVLNLGINENSVSRVALDFAKNRDVAQVLLDNGVYIDQPNRNGRSPLHVFSYHGKTDLINFALEHGANIEAKDSMGDTPLVLAVLENHKDAVEVLLGNGANPSVKTSDGRTMPEVAKEDNREDIAELFTEESIETLKKQVTQKKTKRKETEKLKPEPFQKPGTAADLETFAQALHAVATA